MCASSPHPCIPQLLAYSALGALQLFACMQRLQVPPRCVPPKVRQPLPELHAHVRDDGAQRRRLDEAALEEEADESALLASQAMRSKARAVREADEANDEAAEAASTAARRCRVEEAQATTTTAAETARALAEQAETAEAVTAAEAARRLPSEA